MAERGRKSAASFEVVVANLPGQRPEPQADLTQEQAAEWRAVVATKPADWFGRDTHAMLADYCRHVVLARRIAAEIEKAGGEWAASAEALKRFDKLGAMLERHTRTVASLATRMRLTQQSRYNAQSANTAANRGGATARKPWDFGAG